MTAGNRIATFGLLVLAAGALGVAVPARAGERSVSISTDDAQVINACDQVRVRFGDESAPLPMARDESRLVVPKAGTPLLELHLRDSGGVTIAGWDRDEYAVTACKAAGARTDARARDLLSRIAVGLEGGRLSVRGPEEEDWVVYLIVRVPRQASLDLEVENGPLDLNDVSGVIKARTSNGPVSLRACRGEIEVEAENGPVSVTAGGGRQNLSARNGPLSIQLQGRVWDGAGMVARAENGPVSLKIPDDYKSGVRLEMSENSPLHCHAAGCEQAFRTSDDGSRRFDFGSSTPIIRITAGNGPVDVRAGRLKRRSGTI